jgi:NADPH2:quinone reductase
VLVSVGLGGFASAVSAAEGQLVTVPSNMDAAQAATFTQSYCTALFALRTRARLQPGERVLVLGAGGGVGLAAIDVARWLGCEVVGAASTEEKRAAALSAGAAEVVDSSVAGLKYRDVTGWVDVVVDPVGGEHSLSALRALKEGGRLLVIGFASGTIPQIPANHVLLRNREVIGVDWGAWAMSHETEQRSLLDELIAAVAGGQLHPVAPVRYPLDDVVGALKALRSRRVTGKVALIP